MSVAYQEITRETSRAHTSRRHPKLRVVGEQSAAVHSKSRGEEVCHGDAPVSYTHLTLPTSDLV